MGNQCSPENLKKLLPIYGEASGQTRMTESQRTDMQRQWERDALAVREIALIQQKVRENQPRALTANKVYQSLRKATKREPKNDSERMARKAWEAVIKLQAPTFADAASVALPSKFIKPLFNKMKATYGESLGKPMELQKAKWKAEIAPLAEKIEAGILKSFVRIKDPKKRAKFLEDTYGLKGWQTDAAMEYLDWVKNGAHLQTARADKAGELVKAAITPLARANAMFNLPWTMYNVLDLHRVASGAAFRSPTAGVMPTLRALKKSLRQGFTPEPELESKLEAGDLFRETVNVGSKLDPFSNSVTFQRNFAYHLDKELGGDGYGLISSHVFDYLPFDRPELLRNTGGGTGTIFRLAKFMANESNYLKRLLGRAFGLRDKETQAQAVGELMVWTAGRLALLGSDNVLPSEIMWLMEQVVGKEAMEEFTETVDELTGINWMDNLLQASVDTVMGEGAVDVEFSRGADVGLSSFPKMGLTFRQLGSKGKAIAKQLGKIIGSDEPVDTKVLRGLTMGMHISNIFPYIPHVPIPQIGVFNNNTLTKMVNAWADSYDLEESAAKTKYVQAVLGYYGAEKGDGVEYRQEDIQRAYEAYMKAKHGG